jgi:hypothetical protein
LRKGERQATLGAVFFINFSSLKIVNPWGVDFEEKVLVQQVDL